MAVQEVPSSVLEARYATDIETDDANMAASNITQAQTLTKSEGGLHDAGASESDGKDYFSESDEESDLDAGTYLDQLSGLDVGSSGLTRLAGNQAQSGPNTQNSHGVQAKSGRALQPRQHQVQRADKRLNAQLLDSELDDTLESFEGSCNIGSSAAASVRRNANKQSTGVAREKDKADRATYQTVLDPRTRLVLVKMLNAGLFNELNGCVSTGKEANVYQAATADGSDLAVKIFKTSILTFKDRNRYVQGDFRFRTGYCKSNPRKMVKLWAEKEFRNLARLKAVGIRCPQPVHLRMHVLVMEFVGSHGVAAPRLKDAKVPLDQQQSFYTQLVLLIRQMYQECRLVHADLSEYNILVHEGELWIIDVSQSVDLDHPRALDFLREDATHVNAYFNRAGVATLTTRELFEFVVDPNINAGNINQAIEALIQVSSSRPAATGEDEIAAKCNVLDPNINAGNIKEAIEALIKVFSFRSAASGEDEIAAKIFHEAYIPRRLIEVEDYEGDFERLHKAGPDENLEGIYYQTLAGMRKDMTGAAAQPATVAQAQLLIAEQADVPSSSAVSLASQDTLQPVSAAGKAPAHIEHAEVCAVAKLHSKDCEKEASSSCEEGDSSRGESDDEDETEGKPWSEREGVGPEAQKAARKAHKVVVKESNRERRKQKMKKHVKKRAINKHKHK